ncbi:MAG: uroporphyrinogen decarboxylase, partial [Alphaproteobacteria bacterium]
MSPSNKPLLRALAGTPNRPPPIWLMRQAGRYLPEYRETRAKASNFIELCLSPDLATEITLQPVRRYGLDAAILFSDILVVPYGMGQRVWFEEGTGPRLDTLLDEKAVAALQPQALRATLAPVYETVARVRAALGPATALIGFAGAPWTVASYMIEGGTSKDFAKAKVWAYCDPASFQRLIDVLVEATTDHLLAQIEAGAEVVQIFDSWAGVWPEEALRRWCLAPLRRIVSGLRAVHPDVPVIAFPRGAGVAYETFAAEAGVDALGLDTTVPLAWAHERLQSRLAVQGNLDPVLLVAGGEAMRTAAAAILRALGDGPLV